MKITQLEILNYAHELAFHKFMKNCEDYEKSNYKDKDAKLLRDIYLDKMHEISELIKAELKKDSLKSL